MVSRVPINEGELKSLYDDVITAVDNFFYQWDASAPKPI